MIKTKMFVNSINKRFIYSPFKASYAAYKKDYRKYNMRQVSSIKILRSINNISYDFCSLTERNLYYRMNNCDNKISLISKKNRTKISLRTKTIMDNYRADFN